MAGERQPLIEHRCLSPRKGALVGGVITFIWMSISWMVLPFHHKSIHVFSDAATVVNALESSSPSSGVYILNDDPKGRTAPTDPFVFVSYNKGGLGSMGLTLAFGLGLQMIGAFFWTWILGKIPGLTLKDAALYGFYFGLCVGVLGAMPNWAWWKFPFWFSFLYLIDAAIAWTLASLALSRCYAPACPLPR